MPEAHTVDRFRRAQQLGFGNCVGNAGDGARVECLSVAANDAGKALEGEFAGGRPAVRRAGGVGIGRKCVTPEMHVPQDRESFRADPSHRAIERHGLHDRLDRRSPAPIYRSSPERSRSESVRPLAATAFFAIGMISVVVDPTSMSSADATLRARSVAVAIQLAAATAKGSARASSTLRNVPRVEYTWTVASGKATRRASRIAATPSRLVRNACDNSAVMVTA